MTTQSLLFLLLAAVGVVLSVVLFNLLRLKRREEDILSRKIKRQCKLMDMKFRLLAMLY